MAHAAIESDRPIDLRAVLWAHLRGYRDPTMRLTAAGAWRAVRTPEGPATLRLVRTSDRRATAEAWGDGAEWAAAHAPALVGVHDDPGALRPVHRVIAELARRFPGVVMGRTGLVWDALLPAILEQKVTGDEARRAYRGLVLRYGEAAPGPTVGGARLFVPPAPDVVARLPYHAFHPFGVERRRADTIRRAAAAVPRIERLVDEPFRRAEPLLRAIPGVGPWTAAEVGIRAWGDPDAVSVGDFHLPNLVAWALAGEPRGDDARMLELLEPYRGQRARVIRLLEQSGIRPPAFGPRMAPRRIEAL
jgi:3-methyladenine DNA glycosylase/8-oxoguanine DNA glycosylase